MPDINFKKRFGASVRGWRHQLGISQEQLAERASLHRTYISDVERGSRNVSLENIERLAQALEISVAAFFPQSELQNVQDGTGGHRDGEVNLVDVLLVEDNPDDVELTLHAFKKAHFANRVSVVRDGAKALEYIFCRGEYSHRHANEHPEIILLDLDLPKVSGLEVLARIKADQRTARIPVVILTISSDNHNVAECQRLGADNYIVKPVSFQGLSQATPGLNLQWGLLSHPDLKTEAAKKQP